MIGRRTEFDWLLRSLAAAADDEPSTVFIAGEAGVGKSRLVAEFATFARAEGATVLVGECLELTQTPLPYAPLIEVLRGLPRTVSPEELDALLGDGRADLALLAPELGRRVTERRFELQNEHVQSVVFERTLGLLRRLANRAPTALVIEDLHWSDRPTTDFVQFLVRNLDDAGVLLIVTYRSDELHRRHPLRPVLGELERRSDVDRIELEPLGRADTEALTIALRGRSLAPDELQLVYRRADGNPFFIEELLAGDLSEALPDRLRDVVLHRVGVLSDLARRVLAVASVVGRDVDHDLLSALADDDVLSALREAIDAQILIVDAERGRYRFRHALTREAIYDELLPPERTALHRAVAIALEDDPSLSIGSEPTRLSEEADHWFAAHEVEKAAVASVRAGHALEEVGAFSEALRHYERTLELDVEGIDRVDVLARAAEASFVCGQVERAIEMTSIALRLPEASQWASHLYERRGSYRWESSDPGEAESDFRCALERAVPGSREEARSLAALGHFLNLAGETDQARPLIRRAVVRCRATGERAMEARALTAAATIEEIDGNVSAARSLHKTARSTATASGNAHEVMRAYCNSTVGLMFRGEIEEARRRNDEVARWLSSRGYDHLLAMSVAEDADTLIEGGEFEEAESRLTKADDALLFFQSASERNMCECFLRSVVHQRQEADAARRRLESALAGSRLPQDQACLVYAWYTVAFWFDDASFSVDDRWTPSTPIDSLHFDVEIALLESMLLADSVRRDGSMDLPDVAILERQVMSIRAARGITISGAALANQLAAEISVIRGIPDPKLHIEAAAQFLKCGMKLWHAIALWRGACSYLDLDEHLAGAELLQRSFCCAELMKARSLAGRIEKTANSYSIPLPAVAVRPQRLTRREREVLGLLRVGKTNRQIADELYISVKTASVHVTNIMAKLGVSSRYEAADQAERVLAAP